MSTSIPQTAAGRRQFINAMAGSAAIFGFSSFITPADFDLCNEFSPDDPENWASKIKGRHKMVFDATQPHGIYPFAWPRVFLMSNKATGTQEKDCCAVVVLRHAAIPYAFDHAAWEKYKFGEVFQAVDPKTGEPSLRNPFWKPAKGEYHVPGIGEVAIGINELQENGVMFSVCSAAITVFSNAVADKMNLPPEEVKADWMKALLPGIQPVPSGVWALGRAQEKGCSYIFAG